MGWTIRAGGDAAAHEVWERYAQPDRWPDWAPQLRRVSTSERICAGLTGTVHPLVGPGLRFRVDTVDEAERTWSWTVRFGPVRLRLAHGVESASGGSATWLRVDGPAPLVLPYLPIAWLALRRLTRR